MNLTIIAEWFDFSEIPTWLGIILVLMVIMFIGMFINIVVGDAEEDFYEKENKRYVKEAEQRKTTYQRILDHNADMYVNKKVSTVDKKEDYIVPPPIIRNKRQEIVIDEEV